jgi:hypothetical protein
MAVSDLLGCVQTECPALGPNVQTGSQNMLNTVPLLSTTSRSSVLSWALCPISFGNVVFKLGANTSDGLAVPDTQSERSLRTTL